VATFPLAIRNAQLDAHNARLLARVAMETDDEPLARGATSGGDERRLRGLPCLARGVRGEVPGTRPGAGLR